MSNVFWNTPELRLVIADSRLRRCCCLVAVFLALLALLLIAREQLAVALVLSLPVCLFLYRACPDRSVGYSLRCFEGRWHYGCDAAAGEVELVAASLALPCAVHLVLRPIPAGKRRDLWLFSDAVGEEEYRRLRALMLLSTEVVKQRG